MRRYILAPEAALDLVEIWRYLKNKANVEIAERSNGPFGTKSFSGEHGPALDLAHHLRLF
jgi:hypothetical protein